MRYFLGQSLTEVLANKGLIAILLIFFVFILTAQQGSIESLFKVDYETPLTLDLDEEQPDDLQPVKQKKKKVKKKVFFGIKTKKAFVRTGFGKDIVHETFYVLKENELPPPYARDFYWFDIQKKKIVNSLKLDQKLGKVLHGPYKKTLGDQLLEEGWYYKGMKHRRWVRYNRSDILQGKSYWWKGWPQQSLLAFYDFDRTQMREVIPVHFGERDGEYWAFHRDGAVAVRGQYKFDHKVDVWREYYDNKRIKREVRYPKNPFDFETKPYIVREWNKKGKLIYDYEKTRRKRRY